MNRYVPLAVAILAPVIVNILTFHFLMAPSGLPLALVVAVLWALIFSSVRPDFDGLFQSRFEGGVSHRSQPARPAVLQGDQL